MGAPKSASATKAHRAARKEGKEATQAPAAKAVGVVAKLSKHKSSSSKKASRADKDKSAAKHSNAAAEQPVEAKEAAPESLRTLTERVTLKLKEYFRSVDEASVDLVVKRRAVLVNFAYDKCPESAEHAFRPVKLSGVVNENERGLLIVRNDRQKAKLATLNVSDKFESVIVFDELKKEYSTSQLRESLFKSYDVFFCDRKIIDEVVPFLGQRIKHHWRCPISINLPSMSEKKPSITDAELLEKLNAYYAHYTNLKIREAPTINVRIGSLDLDEKILADNLVEVLQILMKRLASRECAATVKAISIICDDISVRLVEPPVERVVVQGDDAEDQL